MRSFLRAQCERTCHHAVPSHCDMNVRSPTVAPDTPSIAMTPFTPFAAEYVTGSSVYCPLLLVDLPSATFVYVPSSTNSSRKNKQLFGAAVSRTKRAYAACAAGLDCTGSLGDGTGATGAAPKLSVVTVAAVSGRDATCDPFGANSATAPLLAVIWLASPLSTRLTK